MQPDPEPIIEEEEEEEIVTQPDPDPEPIILEEEEEPVAAAREEEEEEPIAAAREEITIIFIEEPEPAEEIEEPVTLAATSGRQYPPLPREIEECGDASTYTEENCARDLDVISVLHGLNFTLKNNWLTDSAENLKGLDRLTEVDIISQNDAFNPDHANYEFQYRNDIPLTEKIEVTYHKEDAFSALFSYKGSNIQILEDVTLKATFYNPEIKGIGIEGYIGGDDGITREITNDGITTETNFGQIRFSVIDVSVEDGQFTDITQVRFSNIHINPGENNVVKGSFKNDGTTSTFPTQVVGELTMKRFYDASTRLDGYAGFKEYEKNRDSRGDNALAGVFLADKTSDETQSLAPLLWENAIKAYNVSRFDFSSYLATLPGGTKDLKIEHKNGSTQITLNNSRGNPITPIDSMAPAAGWRAKRFIETPDKNRGVIFTSYGSDNTNYAYFGYWLTTTGSGSSLRHMIDTFSWVIQDNSITREGTAGLRGSATYSGAAAGIYSIKTGDISDPDLYGGEFVADVTLQAQFGNATGQSVPVADQWKLTGNINDFRSVTDPNHNSNIGDWDLALSSDIGEGTRGADGVMRYDDDDGRGPQPGPGFFYDTYGAKAVTKGGGLDGSWTAAWHGRSNAGDDTGASNDYPRFITGEFKGHFTNGSAVGAFATEYED